MKYGERDEEKYRCQKCGQRLRIYEDLGLRLCGNCQPPRKIREYFRPRRGDPGRREAPPGGGAVQGEFEFYKGMWWGKRTELF